MSSGAAFKKNDANKNREELLLELESLRDLNAGLQGLIDHYRSRHGGALTWGETARAFEDLIKKTFFPGLLMTQ